MLLLNTSIKISRQLCLKKTALVKFNSFSRNMSLIQSKGFINGIWRDAASKQTFEVFNPATGDVVGTVPDMEQQDMECAIDSAYDAFYGAEWQSKSAKDRSQLLKVFCIMCIFINSLCYF